MTTSDNIAAIEKALEGVTPGTWKRITLGGSSTVTCQSRPDRNDTRIPSYGYRDAEHCLAYPCIEDDGRVRWDFVEFSHADAAYIAACSPDRISALLAEARKAEAMTRGLQLLVDAGGEVLKGLDARIQTAPGNSVPVFHGIVDLSDALHVARTLLNGGSDAQG